MFCPKSLSFLLFAFSRFGRFLRGRYGLYLGTSCLMLNPLGSLFGDSQDVNGRAKLISGVGVNLHLDKFEDSILFSLGGQLPLFLEKPINRQIVSDPSITCYHSDNRRDISR